MAITFAPNLSMLFGEHASLERPAAAAAAGFRAVEVWWPFSSPYPEDAEVDGFVAALEDADVALVQMNLFAGDVASGERGVLSVTGREHEFRSSVWVAESIARRTGCSRFNALWGHRQRGASAASQRAVAFRNLEVAVGLLAPVGATVLLEPLTQGENGTYPLLTDSDVLDVIAGLNKRTRDGVRLLADVYHLVSNGGDAVEIFERCHKQIGHIQVADSPGRREPGTGGIPWAEVFSAIQRIWTDSIVALEYRPSDRTENTFDWIKNVAIL